jgi:signal transduction histidine kinase
LLASSRRPARQASIDVNAELRSLSSLVQRTVRAASVTLELVDRPLPVRLDAVQFEQVVLNLVVNARDAMPNGGTLRIATAERDGSVVVEVSDSGEGMAPETLKRIFEPFFTTKPEGQGTGLGLATVWNLVTHAGGTLRVHSCVGEGTTVSVVLPALLD